jgi:hypothetical protein
MCVKNFELKSGEKKECATETSWKIYVSGLVCIPFYAGACCYEILQQIAVLI